jgi:hypothetical protein
MTGFLQRWAREAPLAATVSDLVVVKRTSPDPASESKLADANFPATGDVEAIQEIAGLLAAAYQRFARVPRLPVKPANHLGQDALALSPGQSVHECDRIL